MWTFLGVVTVVLVAGVRGDDNPYQSPYQSPNYAYQYAVKDDYAGVDFSADESRQAENTQGSYKVLLPDGRIQTVVYTVNGPEGGYIADVAYAGEAKYVEAAPYKPAPVVAYKAAPAPAPAYKAAPAPAPAPAPAVKAPAPAPAPAAPAPAPYKPAPSPYKAFPRLQQQATSYKSKIVFTGGAEAEEERSAKALADSARAIDNRIPVVDLDKESRTEPAPIVVVEEVVPVVVVEETARRRSTTAAPPVAVPLEEATPLPVVRAEPSSTVAPTSAPTIVPVARSTTLPPVTIAETIAPEVVEEVVISTTSAPVFVEVEAETAAPVVVETTAAPVVVETTAAAVAAETTVASADESIQAEAEATALETNNTRRFVGRNAYQRFQNFPHTRTFTHYRAQPSFSQRRGRKVLKVRRRN